MWLESALQPNKSNFTFKQFSHNKSGVFFIDMRERPRQWDVCKKRKRERECEVESSDLRQPKSDPFNIISYKD